MPIVIGKDGQARVFGAGAIKQALQRQKREHGKDAHTSIADKPHANNREAERRRRQEERKASKGKTKG